MNIRDQRISKGLSQQKLAFLANVSRYRIHLTENGYLKLKKAEKLRIQRVLTRDQKEGGGSDV